MDTILITGGLGYIGSILLKTLQKKNIEYFAWITVILIIIKSEKN